MAHRRCIAIGLLVFTAPAVAGDDPGTLNFQDVSSDRIVMSVAEQFPNEKYVEAGDYDNDGDLDVVIGNAFGDFGQRRNKLYNNDGGVFSEVSGIPIIGGFSATDVTRNTLFADFTGDGWLDIWVINDSNAGVGPGSDKLYVAQHAGGVFTSYIDETGGRLPTLLTGAACSGTAADFDNDGDTDVWTGNYPFDSQDRLFMNDGSGIFTEMTNDNAPPDIDYTVDIAAADMNGDGKLDVLVSNDFDPNYIYYNDLDGAGSGVGDFAYGDNDTGGRQTLQIAATGENSMEPGDFDDDGDLDIYWANRATGGGDRILMNNGNGANGMAQFVLLPDEVLPLSVTARMSRKVEVFDLNGDGLLDVVVGKEDGVNGRPTILRNISYDGEIAFIDWTPASAFPTGSVHDGWHAAVFDSNGDGDLDIMLGGREGDHLFEQVPAPVYDEDDLDNGVIPDVFNGEPAVVVGTAAENEADVYQINGLSLDGFVSAVVNGPDDYRLELLDPNNLVIATSDRGGLEVEEALQSYTVGLANFMRVRVRVIESAGAGESPADFDGNGVVDAFDLAQLLDGWGPCDGECVADLDGDGAVGPFDLAQLLDVWGPNSGGPSPYVLEVLSRDG